MDVNGRLVANECYSCSAWLYRLLARSSVSIPSAVRTNAHSIPIHYYGLNHKPTVVHTYAQYIRLDSYDMVGRLVSIICRLYLVLICATAAEEEQSVFQRRFSETVDVGGHLNYNEESGLHSETFVSLIELPHL